MRVALMSLAAIAFLAGLAHADGPKIGVIVVGD